MKRLSRRQFLKVSSAAAAGALLTACQPAQATPVSQQPAAETAAPAAEATVVEATKTPRPTPTITSTPTPFPERAYRKPEIISVYPAAKSRVVRARNAKAWAGDKVDPAVVRAMVDSAIVSLTGLEEPLAAWKSLFNPDEKIAIKVNAFRNSTIWTHPELVKAVTDSLTEAGITPENITVFDFYTNELETAGYTVNADGPGVRCVGTDEAHKTRWPVGSSLFSLSDHIVNCDALINMPVLKAHMLAGMTFALKNHYGSVSYPDGLHSPMAKCMAELNLLPPIKGATRLVVGDVLHANVRYASSWPYWTPDTISDSILMSFDPLATDVVGRDILRQMMVEKEFSTDSMFGQSDPWVKTCTEMGVGAGDLADIDLVEV